VTGIGPAKPILGGTDFDAMYADEKFAHSGNFIVSDHGGDVLIWYDGASQGPEGTYGDVLEGHFANKLSCWLAIRTVSVNAGWRALNRRPLLGMGTFGGEPGGPRVHRPLGERALFAKLTTFKGGTSLYGELICILARSNIAERKK
jgi:hypothetical protein